MGFRRTGYFPSGYILPGRIRYVLRGELEVSGFRMAYILIARSSPPKAREGRALLAPHFFQGITA